MRSSLELVDVYGVKGAAELLYRFLALRPKNVNISHRKMPTFPQHLRFFNSKPYKAWYFLRAPSGEDFGSIYLTKHDEIGIFLLKSHQGKGCGKKAVKLIIRKHPGVKRFLANISPKNPRSLEFFASLGFKHIQNTFEFAR